MSCPRAVVEAGIGPAMLIGTASAAADLLAPLFASRREESIAVIHLAEDRRLLALTFERPGSVDAVELPIGSILAAALRLGARSIIVAHNHPSGDARPRDADHVATRMLAEAARAVDVRLHDHLIFAGAEWRSFRALELL